MAASLSATDLYVLRVMHRSNPDGTMDELKRRKLFLRERRLLYY